MGKMVIQILAAVAGVACEHIWAGSSDGLH